MFEPFQKFVIPAAHRYGVSKELKASHMCRIFREIISEIFPNLENPEEFISPASFHETYILINVSGPGFAQEIMMKKNDIIKKFNEKAGKEILQTLRTQIKNSTSR